MVNIGQMYDFLLLQGGIIVSIARVFHTNYYGLH